MARLDFCKMEIFFLVVDKFGTHKLKNKLKSVKMFSIEINFLQKGELVYNLFFMRSKRYMTQIIDANIFASFQTFFNAAQIVCF